MPRQARWERGGTSVHRTDAKDCLTTIIRNEGSGDKITRRESCSQSSAPGAIWCSAASVRARFVTST